MMPNNGYIDIFERYRNGELSEAELKDFEARLVYDSELKEAFEEYEQIEVGIKNHFRNKLKTKLQDLDQQMDTTPKKTNVLKLVVWTSSLAAAVVLGCFILQHFTHPNNIQLAEQYWPHEEGLPVKMSTKGKYDDAMNAFKLGEFERAKKLLKPMVSDTSFYFQGVIDYELQNSIEASNKFIRVDKKSVYYNKAQFCLGIVFLGQNNIGKAKLFFQNQIDNKTEFATDSKEILEKLK